MKRNFVQDVKRFLRLAGKGSSALFVTLAVQSGIAALSGILMAQAIRGLVDYFVNDGQTPLWSVGLQLAAYLVCFCALAPWLGYRVSRMLATALARLRKKVYAHLEALPVAALQKTHSGDMVARVNGDLDACEGAFEALFRLVEIFVSLGLAVPYLAGVDGRIALIVFASGVVFGLFMLKVIQPLRQRQQKIRAAMGGMAGAATESVTGFSVVKMFGLGQLLEKKFEDAVREVSVPQKSYGMVMGIIGFGEIFIWLASQSLVALCGILFVFDGTMEVTALTAAIAISTNVVYTFVRLAGVPGQLQTAFAGVERVHELFDTPAEPERYPVPGDAPGTQVFLDNVDFAYENGQKVLDGVSITAKAGARIALVGDSGSGKTTIIKLIAGLYAPAGGQMAVGGAALAKQTIQTLRQRIAYVPQDAYMFNGTIAQNIGYGVEGEATEADIRKAAQMAGAEDFILQKPGGYEAEVGERGIQLSGGERQRIAIARALLKDAPILLLDEATSSLDGEAEQHVQDALETLMQGRTSVVVAHRLSTIVHADCIYFLRAGRVLASGRHETLLETCPPYAELFYKKFQTA